MSPEKAAKLAASTLMQAYKKISLFDQSEEVGLIAHSIRAGPSGRSYLLRSDAQLAIRKAARHLVAFLDSFPMDKCWARLADFVVEEKDSTTPLSQVHDRLRINVLTFIQAFASQQQWEVVYAVRGMDISDGPISISACSFSLMDEHQFLLWGRRETTGTYDPPLDARVGNDWRTFQAPLLDQVVATVRVRAADHDHARAKGRSRIEEVLNLVRFSQLSIGTSYWPAPAIGLPVDAAADHCLCMCLDNRGFSSNRAFGGPTGTPLSMMIVTPAWTELEQMLRLDLGIRNEIQLRITTALTWVGQAVLAPTGPIRLVTLVSALEALLIEESESIGKKRKLASRISKLTATTDREQQEKYKEVEELYETRSECVHAGLLDVEKEEVDSAGRVVVTTVEALAKPPYSALESLSRIVSEIDPKLSTATGVLERLSAWLLRGIRCFR
jgi:hypothetical protein